MIHHRILPIMTMVVLAFLTSASRADGQYDIFMKNLNWRNIGPALMGGRIDDIEVAETSPRTIYVGTATGGVFKSENNGTTWQALFDSQPTSSIGDIAVASSNTNIVWVGTGEANNRQSSSWGDGVYKSIDAGKTWTNMGLADTHHIDRIVIDPRNPDVVYVAALGHLWGPNKDRGLFKTIDGGKTWTNTLFINEDTGVTDVVIDPSSPDTLIAATYQRRRTPFGFNGGGPGSGLHKTIDGGKTWVKLSKGLPTTELGRIGLDISRSNPKVLCAQIESAKSGFYRSEDGGENWARVSDNNNRPMYYSQVRIDPTNDQRIWTGGLPLSLSKDGGKTFISSFPEIHSDFHAIWIDPKDSNHVISGCDGGLQSTYDSGKTWDFINTIPLAQFYEVAYDMRKPYWVYGGLQDNGSWGGPSSTYTAMGPTNDEWFRVGGGDGFYCQADPSDNTTVYSESQNGAAGRMNTATGERKSIRPRPPAGEPPYRFDWNSPLMLSPHNPKKIYMAGNRLFISEDRGDTWRRTEDLSGKPDRTKIPIMGVIPGRSTLSIHDGQSTFGQIVTITESPVATGLLYAGTDDGNLQVSHDDGRSWKNVADRVAGVPKGTYVSRVTASHHMAGRIYATFDNHRNNDFKPYVFVSEDYGDSWHSISGNLAEGNTVKVIREHYRNPNLLFVGTERGAFVSFDRGGSWSRFGEPLPMVPVYDIQIHPRENDLILATHGRGIWILDDITAMEQAEKALVSNALLFDPRPAVMFRTYSHKGNTGHKIFVAPNATTSAVLRFYLKDKVPADVNVKLTIMEKDGKTVIREVRAPIADQGLNRVLWDMRYPSVINPPNAGTAARTGTPSASPGIAPTTGGRRGGGRGGAGTSGDATGGAAGGAQGGRGGGGGGFTGRGAGPRVLPGTYLVRLDTGKEQITKPITVEDDPRIKLTDAQRKQILATVMRVNKMARALSDSRSGYQDVRTQLTSVKNAPDFAKAPQTVKDAVAALGKRVDGLQAQFSTVNANRGGGGGAPGTVPDDVTAAEGSAPQTPAPATVRSLNEQINTLLFSIDSITEPPSAGIRQEIEQADTALKTALKELEEIQKRDIPSANKLLEANKLQTIKVSAKVARG